MYKVKVNSSFLGFRREYFTGTYSVVDNNIILDNGMKISSHRVFSIENENNNIVLSHKDICITCK